MAVERFSVEEHFATEERVGTKKCEIINSDNEKSTVLFVYSSKEFVSKEDAIQNTHILLKDSKTGKKQEVKFDSPLGQFAKCIELDSPNMELESLICKNVFGEVVYTYEA